MRGMFSHLNPSPLLVIFLAAVPGTAMANPLAWVSQLSIAQWLQFGALGLTALGLVLGFILLWNGKRQEGYAFLLIVLAAGLTFLYAQTVAVRPGIDLVITPTWFEPSDAAPTISSNGVDLGIKGGRHSLACNDRVLLTFNIERLTQALAKARSESLTANSLSSVENQASVGFDEDAGGTP